MALTQVDPKSSIRWIIDQTFRNKIAEANILINLYSDSISKSYIEPKNAGCILKGEKQDTIH